MDDATLIATLKRHAPHLSTEIDALTRNRARPKYVELKRPDGRLEVMTIDEYQRLSAMDLQHVGLRIVSERELHGR